MSPSGNKMSLAHVIIADTKTRKTRRVRPACICAICQNRRDPEVCLLGPTAFNDACATLSRE